LSEIKLKVTDNISKKSRNWLILSHCFNMDGRAASQTITDKLPFFIESGVNLYVLSAITGKKDDRFFHKQVVSWGPSAFRFDFRHWFANRFKRGLLYKVITPLISITLAPLILIEKIIWGFSSQWSWSFPAYFNGLNLIKKNNIDLIYSTGGAWSAHLAAYWLKRKTKISWIAEIHDPLVQRKNNLDFNPHTLRQSDEKKKYWLEKKICLNANLVWWFTDGALEFAKKRNPNLGMKGYAKGVVIVPGANPPNIEKHVNSIKHQFVDQLNISHFGSLTNDRSLVDVLKVLPVFFDEYPQAKKHIRFNVYGAQLDTKSRYWLSKSQFRENVIEHGRLEFDSSTGLSGREQIAIKMQKSDILLLLHGNTEWCREYIPSKVYDYFWTNRPIWGLIYKNPQLCNLLNERSSYISDVENTRSIIDNLRKIYLQWKEQSFLSQNVTPITVKNAVRKIYDEILD